MSSSLFSLFATNNFSLVTLLSTLDLDRLIPSIIGIVLPKFLLISIIARFDEPIVREEVRSIRVDIGTAVKGQEGLRLLVSISAAFCPAIESKTRARDVTSSIYKEGSLLRRRSIIASALFPKKRLSKCVPELSTIKKQQSAFFLYATLSY